MRVLVTSGSKRGGTEGIARIVGDSLRAEGFDVDLRSPREAEKATGFDAAIVGGALYAGRWHRAARRFVSRCQRRLQRVPVWFFSSGPLDDSSDREDIPPTPQVRNLMERVGALGHVTFGGRLTSNARGFPASAMAKTRAGDWRNEARIKAWAKDVARALPTAQPGAVVIQPGGSFGRLVAHGALGWALCAATMAFLLAVSPLGVALVHAIVAPVVFAGIAWHYFRAPGAHDASGTALAFVATVALLDLVVIAGLLQRSFAMFGSLIGLWVPVGLIGVVTWAIGEWIWIVPPPTHAQAGAS
jgi:menaquinone-dependent protoporphyrinogen oxidase